MTVVSERANLKFLEKYRCENLHYIYEMVFHPNGNLCAGWSETEDILDSFVAWQKNTCAEKQVLSVNPEDL